MSIVVFPADAVDTDGDGVADTPVYTGQQVRQALAAILGDGPAARPLGTNSGVSPGTSTSTVTATATTWTVQPHAGVLDLETAAAAGPYFYACSSAATGAMTGADSTSQRVDSIFVQLSDPSQGDGSTIPGGALLYRTGTPGAAGGARGAAGGPPAMPARSIELAQITVPANGGGNPSVAWVAPYCVAAGGILPVPAGTYPATPYLGQYVDDANLGLLRWNGAAWVRPFSPPAFTALSGFSSGFSPNSFGFAPGFVVDAATGKVTLRGNIKKNSGNFASGGTALLTLPAALVPAQDIEVAVACTSTAVSTVRVEINTSGVLSVLIPSGANVTWVSLDGIEYWLN